LSDKYSNLPRLSLRVVPSRIYGRLLSVASLSGLCAPLLTWQRGYPVAAFVMTILVLLAVQVVRGGRQRPMEFRCQGVAWTLLGGPSGPAAIELAEDSICLPWLIVLRWRPCDGNGWWRTTWLFSDSAERKALWQLRRSLLLQR
jgi:Membrane-bound toxin component of toxin-antitoxin system